jgi:hypothetical protein
MAITQFVGVIGNVIGKQKEVESKFTHEIELENRISSLSSQIQSLPQGIEFDSVRSLYRKRLKKYVEELASHIGHSSSSSE